MSKLKPCFIFDIDGTLVKTPNFDFYGFKYGDDTTALLRAEINREMAFLYHAVDYLINDPPTWVLEEGANHDWPKDIFFITARSELLREPTVQRLCDITHDSGASMSKRLLMRPEYMDDIKKDTSYTVKKHLIQKLRERGYEATMVFDNDVGALQAFLEAGTKVLNRTIYEDFDRDSL